VRKRDGEESVREEQMQRHGRTPRTPPPETAESSTKAGMEANTGGTDINDLRRELAEQQRIIQQLQQERNPNLGMTVVTENTLGNFLHFSIRDALEAVPNFDGENIAFVYFVEGCEEALSMVAPTQEVALVRAIRNKLKGDAHRSILGKTFGNMQELVEFLRTKYGPRETVYEAQGRLAYLYQKKDEKVAAYANRVRELGKRILDAHKRETGQISLEFRDSIDKHLKTSFLRGLNREIIISKEGTFEEIESRAIDAEKELETINMIRRVVLAENIPTEKRASTRRIEAEIITCQFCHKKGHTADRCWQINKFQGANGNKNLTNPGTLHGNNNISNNNNNNNAKPSTSDNQSQANEVITCRYCKKLGHSIEECRKRIYNNNLRQNNQIQGNGQIPERTGAIPGNIKIRPTQVIAAEVELDTEQ